MTGTSHAEDRTGTVVRRVSAHAQIPPAASSESGNPPADRRSSGRSTARRNTGMTVDRSRRAVSVALAVGRSHAVRAVGAVTS